MPSDEYFEGKNKPVHELSISQELKLHKANSEVIIDPITFEVIRHRLVQINDEQRIAINRVSGSPVAAEVNDFNVVISDQHGEVVVLGNGITYHLQSVSIIKWILENRSKNPGVRPGDMWLTTDPWVGAIHQADVSVVQPIFYGDELFGWTAATIHQVDVGGINVGSFCFDAVDAYSEGALIPPIKLVENYTIRQDIEDMYLRQSRASNLVGLDNRAFIAGHNVSRKRMLELIEEYGVDVVKTVMNRMMDHSETMLRQRLLELPDGKWMDETYHEWANGKDRGVHKIILTVTKEKDKLIFDYHGTDKQAGMINCTFAGLMGATMAGICSTLCSDIPWAVGGFTRLIEFVSEEGTINNAKFPAGCSAGSIAGCYQTMNAVVHTLGRMLSCHPKYKDHALSGCQGSWACFNFGGTDKQGQPIVNTLLDSGAAGIGARSWRDGDNTGGVLQAPICQISNVEMAEYLFPFIYLYRREEVDTGGAGRWRGGVGGSFGIIPYDTKDLIEVPFFTFGMAFPTAAGINGGLPTKGVEAYIIKESNIHQFFDKSTFPNAFSELSGEKIQMMPKGSYWMDKNDVAHVRWQGGGGYGDPLKREPERVYQDVQDGYVSIWSAEYLYGVIIENNHMVLDATEQKREQMYESRKTLPRYGEV
jgi:N-methylhydantoinase B